MVNGYGFMFFFLRVSILLQALKRACLVRELQLLFLHVMGEARDCPLVEGIAVPPVHDGSDSTLAEVSYFLCQWTILIIYLTIFGSDLRYAKLTLSRLVSLPVDHIRYI